MDYHIPLYFAMQNQKAVSVYFTSKQILPFSFAEQCRLIMRWRRIFVASEKSILVDTLLVDPCSLAC